MWGINWTHISIEPWVPAPMIEKEFLPVAKPPDANVPNQMHQSVGMSPRDTNEIYILSCVNVKRLHFLVGWDFVPGFPGRWWMRTSPNDFGTDGSPLTHGWRKPGWPLRKSQKASIHLDIYLLCVSTRAGIFSNSWNSWFMLMVYHSRFFKGDIPLKGFLGKAARGEPEVVGTG